MYPFQIKIKEPEMIKIFLRLERDRIVEVPKYMSRRLSGKIKPIRTDIVVSKDRRYNEKWMALKPDLSFEMKPLNNKKSVYKLKFHKMF